MELKQIETKIIECIRKGKDLNITDENLKQCEDLTGLGFDSIDLMHNIIDLESVFTCEFCEDDLEFDNVNNFKKLSSLIYSYLNE